MKKAISQIMALVLAILLMMSAALAESTDDAALQTQYDAALALYEAGDYAGAYEAFRTLDAVVIGVSKDSAASHRKFAEKNALYFLLLSDPDHAVMEAYGVWQEKKMCGKVSMGTVRTTFIIDEKGVVEKVMEKVKPDTNAADVAAYLSGK